MRVLRKAFLALAATTLFAGVASALPATLTGTMTSSPSRDSQHTFPVTFTLDHEDAQGVGSYTFTYDLNNYGIPGGFLLCRATLIRRGNVVAISSSGCLLTTNGAFNPTECNFALQAGARRVTGKAFCSHYGPAGDNSYDVDLAIDRIRL